MSFIGTKDFKIVANKFLTGFVYSIVVFLIIVGMTWIGGGGLPVGYAFLGSLIYAFLEAFLKFFRKYKPEQYDEFKWVYEMLIEFGKKLFAKIKK